MRIALCQMLVEPGLPERNLARARAMICRAAAGGAHFAVLPECLDLGWTHPGAPDLARPFPGPVSDELCAAARDSGIHVVAGLTERAGPRLHNAAVLISPEGRILLHHRKINLLPGVETVYATGDRLGVARAAGAVIGIDICADNFPESLELAGSLARMGAQAILSPCAWAVDADHDNTADPYGSLWRGSYGSLAARWGVAVVGVSNVGRIEGGPWAGRKCIGCSLAMSAEGAVLLQGPYGEDAEALLTVDIALT